MSALLLLAGQLALHLVLLVVVLCLAVFSVWVWWDCTAGPSSQMARENARRAHQGVDG